MLIGRLLICFLLAASLSRTQAGQPGLASNDVVVLVGGGDVAALQWSGHLDVLFTVAEPSVKLRNVAWEGDTVFEQKRDFGFPPITENVRKAGGTAIILGFGRMESLKGAQNLDNFRKAYKDFLNKLPDARKYLLVPIPFETTGGRLPDLSARNHDTAHYATAIKGLGDEMGIPVLDTSRHLTGKLTTDGVLLGPQGTFQLARAIALEMGLAETVDLGGPVDLSGNWVNTEFEELRKIAIEKNKLWFNYFRPQNWAFLGGDRTTQQSSRDHINKEIRWFPTEMEQFIPLIESREKQLQSSAGKLR